MGERSTVTVVMPARYASSRFPGKPLVRLSGKPMIQHVYEQAQSLWRGERVVVATDDQRIQAAVEGFGGRPSSRRNPIAPERIASQVWRTPSPENILSISRETRSS